MKITSRAVAIALPALLLSSALANATTDREAVQACSEAIVTTIEKKQQAEVRLRIDESGIDPGEKLDRRTVFAIDALEPSTGKLIGKFSCLVDRSAQVRQLRTLRLHVPGARRGSRS